MKNIYKIRQKFNGFTLLELLIVVAIMGILVALGTVSYSTAQKKSRDAKRKADIKSLQTGMEQYYAENNAYPGDSDTLSADLSSFFPSGLPTDPKSGGDYTFTLDEIDPVGETYCVCTNATDKLEIAGSGNAYNATCTYTSDTGTKDYFCVSNLQ